MTIAKVTKDIAMPVVYVFGKFTDIERGAASVGAIKEIELLTPGRMDLGTRWRETREVLGRLDDALMEVTSFKRDQMYTITHYKAGVRVDATFRFKPKPGGTRVTIEYDLGSNGASARLLAPLGWAIRREVTEVLERDLADLKEVLEHRRCSLNTGRIWSSACREAQPDQPGRTTHSASSWAALS